MLCLSSLKNHCVQLGLRSSGLKAELIARLMSKLQPGTAAADTAEAHAQAIASPSAKNKRRAEATLKKFRLVAEIRAELERRGLATAGLKAVISLRLQDAVYMENGLLDLVAEPHGDSGSGLLQVEACGPGLLHTNENHEDPHQQEELLRREECEEEGKSQPVQKVAVGFPSSGAKMKQTSLFDVWRSK